MWLSLCLWYIDGGILNTHVLWAWLRRGVEKQNTVFESKQSLVRDELTCGNRRVEQGRRIREVDGEERCRRRLEGFRILQTFYPTPDVLWIMSELNESLSWCYLASLMLFSIFSSLKIQKELCFWGLGVVRGRLGLQRSLFPYHPGVNQKFPYQTQLAQLNKFPGKM